jgi:hypothetical protein
MRHDRTLTRSSRRPGLSKPYVTVPRSLADTVAATELKFDARTIVKLEESYRPVSKAPARPREAPRSAAI